METAGPSAWPEWDPEEDPGREPGDESGHTRGRAALPSRVLPGDRPPPLDRLAPASRQPHSARLRIGLGAAVVLVLTALLAAVLVTVLGPQSGQQVFVPAASGAAGHGDPKASSGAAKTDPGGFTSSSSPASTPTPVILVHVLGAVVRPGLFELPVDARVIDAVSAAGGFTAAADPEGTNLARPLADGEQLYLPALGEAVPGGANGSNGSGGSAAGQKGSAGAPAVKINLNRATATELDALPRIGPAMAQRIVEYRSANGPFASIDDLRNVTGIGDKTFEGLKDLVTV
jgi:competence protein ComEA